MPEFSTFFLGVSIGVLDRIAFKLVIILLLILYYSVVFCARTISRGCALLVYGCRYVGVNFCPVVWASIFSCTTVGCKEFLSLF